MALVQLHTQHHSAGGLAPATPTCCCCCCVGATVGTLAVLPVMVGLAGGGPRAHRPVASGEWTAESIAAAPQVPRVDRGLRGSLGAGLLALAVAVSPFVGGWLISVLSSTLGASPEATFQRTVVGFELMLVGAVASLTVWAALRARRRGGPMWPPLVATFVLLPVAFFVELHFWVPLESRDIVGYGWSALGIGGGVFALGVLSSWSARRS